MSKLLLALLEVRSLLVLDFSWDVQATFGTFAKQVYVGPLVSGACLSYFCKFWNLDPSGCSTFRGMSEGILGAAD